MIDPLGSTIYARNATVPFISASLYKLPLMAKIYQLIENGDVSLDQPLTLEKWYFMVNEGGDSYYDDASASSSTTVEEALFASGAYSSNVGALALTSLTDWAAIQSMAHVLGMMGSYLTVDLSSIPQWPPQLVVTDSAADLDTAVAFVESEAQSGPIMLTTPADIAHFFDLLLKGEVVHESASAAIYQILNQQAVSDRIPQLLPSNTKTVHKTGNLDQVVHDAGIIYTARGPVILAALVQADPDGCSGNPCDSATVRERFSMIAHFLPERSFSVSRLPSLFIVEPADVLSGGFLCGVNALHHECCACTIFSVSLHISTSFGSSSGCTMPL